MRPTVNAPAKPPSTTTQRPRTTQVASTAIDGVIVTPSGWVRIVVTEPANRGRSPCDVERIRSV